MEFEFEKFETDSTVEETKGTGAMSHDSEVLRSVADRMQSSLKTVQNELATLQAKVDSLVGEGKDWSGDGAEAFKTSVTTAKNTADERSQALQSTSSQTETGADF